MSTKIFNGYRLTGPAARFHNIQKAVDEAKAIVKEASIKHEIDMLKNLYATALGDNAVKKFLGQECTEVTRAGIRVELDRLKGDHPAAFSMTCEAVFFAISSKTTLMTWYSHNKLEGLVDTLFKAEEYGYWDNTDRPDEVSAQAWRRREKAWDIIGYGPTKNYGFSAIMTYDLIRYDQEAALAFKDYTENVPDADLFKAIRKACSDKVVGDYMYGGKGYDAFFAACKLAKTPEGQAQIEELFNNVKAIA